MQFVHIIINKLQKKAIFSTYKYISYLVQKVYYSMALSKNYIVTLSGCTLYISQWDKIHKSAKINFQTDLLGIKIPIPKSLLGNAKKKKFPPGRFEITTCVLRAHFLIHWSTERSKVAYRGKKFFFQKTFVVKSCTIFPYLAATIHFDTEVFFAESNS